MSLRTIINAHPGTAMGMAGIIVAGAILFCVQQMGSSQASRISGVHAFFTVDDGKTWFVDSAMQTPPFQHDGKPAVRAYVYECAGKQFVSHLERYTPEAQKAIADFRAFSATAKRDPGPGPYRWAATEGREVKRPSEVQWVNCRDTVAAARITRPACPNAADGAAVQVEP